MQPDYPLLEIDRVSKTFHSRQGLFGQRRTAVHAVDDVSLQLCTGETLGLVGESGSGKSTLGRLVVRLTNASSGAIRLDGVDLTSLKARGLREMRRDVQMVFQDPYGSLDPRRTIGASLAEPLKIHGLWDHAGTAKLRELIRTVGLNPDHVNRYPHEFSGGQRQRIGIARALTLNPRILVLDEPVSALDVSIQAQIINLLQTLQRERDLAFLFIAHDLAVVRHVSHRIAVMYLGRIVELAPRDRLYAAPAHPYTRSLLTAVPVPDPAVERARARVTAIGEIGSAASLPSGCRFHPRCPRAREIATGAARPADAGSLQAAGAACVDTTWGRLPAACVHDEPGLAPHRHSDRAAARWDTSGMGGMGGMGGVGSVGGMGTASHAGDAGALVACHFPHSPEPRRA